MRARVSHGTMFVILTVCLAAGTGAASAQALCPKAAVEPFEGFGAGLPRAPETITVDADLRALGTMLPGGTWRMPYSGGLASDGVALEGVSFTRSSRPQFGSTLHTFDVVVDLRAWDNVMTDLEVVVVDGDRSLRLGAITGLDIRCKATSVSRTFSIADRDFVSFFAGGTTPTLRVKRTTMVGGC